jgi:L,D-peptidoglycan transpeptidase YkuD (ErfK/YbiS/YcfS/YnhG family)
MIRLIVVSAGLALLVAGIGKDGRASACPANLANRLADTGTAEQLITIVAPQQTSVRGEARLWRKAGECWLGVDGPWPAWLGRRGVSERKREGDRTTPAGAFGIWPVMYGIAPNPGVRYRYRRIVCGDWWVEDSRSPYYNQFRHVRCGARPPFRITSEDMSRSPTAYRHLAVIRYNMDPVVPGRGSGIFLHVSTGRPTLGCASLALPHLLKTIRWLRPGREPLIVIGTRARIRSY